MGFEELEKALKIAGRTADGDPMNLFKASVCNDATFDVLRSGGALRPPGSDVYPQESWAARAADKACRKLIIATSLDFLRDLMLNDGLWPERRPE
jgi:hypothetical protein